jgi:hypothetical protein
LHEAAPYLRRDESVIENIFDVGLQPKRCLARPEDLDDVMRVDRLKSLHIVRDEDPA